MRTIAQIVEDQGRLHRQMTAIVDKARTAKRSMTAEENAKFDEMHADMEKFSAEKERVMKYEAHCANFKALSPVQVERIGTAEADAKAAVKEGRAEAYTRVFTAYCRVGLEGMTQEQRNLASRSSRLGPQAALTPATGAGGGFTIPQGFEDQLIEARTWFGGIEQFSDPYDTSFVSGSGALLAVERRQRLAFGTRAQQHLRPVVPYIAHLGIAGRLRHLFRVVRSQKVHRQLHLVPSLQPAVVVSRVKD